MNPANDPDAEGLPEVTEHLNVHRIEKGNAGIPAPTWEPPQGEPERPCLPGHEHQLTEGDSDQ